MEIITNREGGILILKLKGRLDTNASMDFEQQVEASINASSKNMIIDFSDLEYICSSGLRVILQAAKKLKSLQRELVLCSMEDYIQEVFEISGFDSFLKIFASKNEAVKSF
ncbi:MAG: STAS domain-containing protein [Desulfobulbaceae bacterium]|nr:STAS domain-containing protein [Desulfobulbaceae bacterium]